MDVDTVLQGAADALEVAADLAAEAEEGRKSAALCHLANIAYRVGRTLKVDPATEEIAGDAEASALATREYRRGYEVPHSV